ncbi:MAG: branched chain amino acid ABC transporter substrate-binding protein [Isosphaera sp.]|nr:branched chain amino acid ABC transporter substrate-binding protein [Isosphaera sp.]
MDRRKFLTAAAGGAGSLLLGGCGGSKDTVVIASSLPRTGIAQGQTESIVNGLKMALEESGGEVAGMKLRHQDMDDATAAQGGWDAAKEKDNAREAANDPNVMAFIGPYNSGAAENSMPILNEAGLVQISPACTSVQLTKKVPGDQSGKPDIFRKSGKVTFCRVCPNDFVQGPLSAVFAKEVLGAKRVYVLDDKELYGSGIAGLFIKKCGDLGIEVLGHDSIVASQQNFKTVIATIKGKNPDLLYFGGTTVTKGPQIAIDMKGEGLTCPLMVPDGCYEKSFVDAAGLDTVKAVPCYATVGGFDPSQLKGAGAEFVRKYKEKHGADPEAYAVYGYEAAKVVLEAIKKVGRKDREAIREAVLATKDFDKGALGKWSFDPDGDTTLKVLTVSKVEGWPFKPVRTVSE